MPLNDKPLFPRIAPSLTTASEIPEKIKTRIIAAIPKRLFKFYALPAKISIMNYNSEEKIYSRPPFFPMLIDLSGKKILVVGGGKIASRRTETLIRCGADVTAVSPNFCKDFPESSQKISREFQPSDIDENNESVENIE